MSSKCRHTYNPLVIQILSTGSNLSHAWRDSVLLSADADTAKCLSVWTVPRWGMGLHLHADSNSAKLSMLLGQCCYFQSAFHLKVFFKGYFFENRQVMYTHTQNHSTTYPSGNKFKHHVATGMAKKLSTPEQTSLYYPYVSLNL